MKTIIYSLCFYLLTPLPSLTANATEKFTGIYSDMYFNQEGGDVLGIEIFIVFSNDGYKVIFQDAEGVPSVPIVIAAEIKDNKIMFELPDRTGYSGKFIGRFIKNKLIGHFESGALSHTGNPIITLEYRRSYWQNVQLPISETQLN